MAQAGSTGRFRVGSLLLKGSLEIFSGSAAPSNGTSGTGAGKAGPGSIYIRTATGAVYTNTNTQLSPTWGVLGTVAALASGHIFVGNGGGAATDVAMSGDATIDNAGAVTIGAKKVLATMVALADGKILVGDAGGAAAAVTPSGDITMTNLGVTAIGAGKVLSAMVEESLIRRSEVTISKAQILSAAAGGLSHANGMEMIPSPGAGKALELISAVLITDYATRVVQLSRVWPARPIRWVLGLIASIPSDR
jgi:hypothetical protein